MEELVPPALVLGCNTPHGIGVLSDWIEEQTGHAPDFYSTGWSNGNTCRTVLEPGDGYGHGYYWGHDDGGGVGCGVGNSSIAADGYGCGDQYGWYSGDGNGGGYGDAYGDGNSADDGSHT